MAKIDNFTVEELTQMVSESNSFNELILKLGYAARSGSNRVTVRKRLDKNGIDYIHYGKMNKTKMSV